MPGILCTHLAALTGFDSEQTYFRQMLIFAPVSQKTGTFSTAIGSILKGSPHEKIHLLPCAGFTDQRVLIHAAQGAQ
jgi:hypothetical protein